MAIGPMSCGIPKTAFPSGDTCPQVQSTKYDLASFAPYCEISSKPSVAMNEGRKIVLDLHNVGRSGSSFEYGLQLLVLGWAATEIGHMYLDIGAALRECLYYL